MSLAELVVSLFSAIFDTVILQMRPKFACLKYVVGSKHFRPDIQKPRQIENAVRDIQCHLL